MEDRKENKTENLMISECKENTSLQFEVLIYSLNPLTTKFPYTSILTGPQGCFRSLSTNANSGAQYTLSTVHLHPRKQPWAGLGKSRCVCLSVSCTLRGTWPFSYQIFIPDLKYSSNLETGQ